MYTYPIDILFPINRRLSHSRSVWYVIIKHIMYKMLLCVTHRIATIYHTPTAIKHIIVFYLRIENTPNSMSHFIIFDSLTCGSTVVYYVLLLLLLYEYCCCRCDGGGSPWSWSCYPVSSTHKTTLNTSISTYLMYIAQSDSWPVHIHRHNYRRRCILRGAKIINSITTFFLTA